jgi:S1-C subfamily serine protease
MDGLLVQQVEDSSPASRAGLTPGDLIVAAGGNAIHGIDELFEILDSAPAGQVELTVLRGAEERTVAVNIGQASDG